MNSNKIPYKNFNKYVLRAPLFSVDFFKSITKEDTISEDRLKTICKDPRIKEAIFLASPSLFDEIMKWLEGNLNQEKSEKIQYSVLKYLSRMSSRCTPFGLFAGTSVGEFGDTTHIELKENNSNKRHTRLDMNYLVALSQHIAKTENIREQLKFYPNTSLYQVGQQFRYIEYTYINTNRIHHIVGVNYNWYLNEIIKASKEGKTINELAHYIVGEDITIEDAKAFVIELTENQILISELEPSVSGPELLKHITNTLGKLKHTQHIISILNDVDQRLSQIDNSIENNSNVYREVSKVLEDLNTSFQLKYLFQTDMILSYKKNTLNTSIVKKIKDALNLLNKLSSKQRETSFSQFQSAFYERYETKPISLSKVLDKDLGIGFIQDHNYGDVNGLVDDLNLPPNPNMSSSHSVSINDIEKILHHKLLECLAINSSVMKLNDDDFEQFEVNWSDLPDTMSSMIEIINIDGQTKVGMNYLGGSSAVNLLGRFCHGDVNIENYAKEITEVEKQINKDKLIAEIVHLPEARAGNILFRPHLRDFEIPYLANSTVKKEYQITIEDLELKAQNPNHIVIKSITHNKEVIPRLSNAHNFSNGALPVYQFLASSQNINKRNGIGFSWGNLEHQFDFLPRVEYKDIILSCKLWNIKKSDIQHVIDVADKPLDLQRTIIQFKNSKNLPSLVMLKDGDNELLINLDNVLSVKMLLNTVKKRRNFQLKEFLHGNDNGVVKETSNSFSNQVIVSFYNEHKLKAVS